MRATEYLKKGEFSDISASTAFYSIYHCLLAIAAKFGYESRNQECTFALVYNLIEEKKIDIKKETMDKIASLDPEEHEKKTTVEIRERYQYGTETELENNLYKELINLVMEVITTTRVIVER